MNIARQFRMRAVKKVAKALYGQEDKEGVGGKGCAGGSADNDEGCQTGSLNVSLNVSLDT